MRTYSNTELPEDTGNRPLVTFALFAYNQEAYIREAIEGAFAQTYEPIELILSDDCSGDRTFEIMQEMAKNYCGPKKVIVRRTEKNCGTLLHVADVARLARGELLVLGAGDDISKPQRTETLVDAWKRSNAWGLCSRFDRIDETGRIISRNQAIDAFCSPDYSLRQYFASHQDEVKIIHGATSAYDLRLFDFLETQPTDYILAEDGALSVLLNLLEKGVKVLDASLVLYRESEQSLTNGSNSGRLSYEKIRKDERAIERFAQSQANRCELLLRHNEKYGASSAFCLNATRLRDESKRQRMRNSWWQTSYTERIQYLLRGSTVSELKYYLPRMLPQPIFIAVKTLLKHLQ